MRAGSAVVLDARAGERYRGETEPIDPVAGHIPGAVSAEWTGDLGDDGHLLDATALRRRYEALGVVDGGEAIASCGSGVTAAFTLFAIERAGLGLGRLYEGSWSDWVSDRSRPVATGPEPGGSAVNAGRSDAQTVKRLFGCSTSGWVRGEKRWASCSQSRRRR